MLHNTLNAQADLPVAPEPNGLRKAQWTPNLFPAMRNRIPEAILRDNPPVNTQRVRTVPFHARSDDMRAFPHSLRRTLTRRMTLVLFQRLLPSHALFGCARPACTSVGSCARPVRTRVHGTAQCRHGGVPYFRTRGPDLSGAARVRTPAGVATCALARGSPGPATSGTRWKQWNQGIKESIGTMESLEAMESKESLESLESFDHDSRFHRRAVPVSFLLEMGFKMHCFLFPPMRTQ